VCGHGHTQWVHKAAGSFRSFPAKLGASDRVDLLSGHWIGCLGAETMVRMPIQRGTTVGTGKFGREGRADTATVVAVETAGGGQEAGA